MDLCYNINCLPNRNSKDRQLKIPQKSNYDCHYIFSRFRVIIWLGRFC